MSTPQSAIFTPMGQHQWYLHLSRTETANIGTLGTIKSVLTKLRQDCAAKKINLVIGFGPTLLRDLSGDFPGDFQAFETIKSVDGSNREAKGTQEELLL